MTEFILTHALAVASIALIHLTIIGAIHRRIKKREGVQRVDLVVHRTQTVEKIAFVAAILALLAYAPLVIYASNMLVSWFVSFF